MKTLVTGANGHLGLNLVRALRDAGHSVRGSVRGLGDAAKLAPLRAIDGVELVEASLERPDQLRAAMEGVDVAFHTAAVYAFREPARPEEILAASIGGAEAALRAAADAGVRKVVLTSSVVTLPLTAPGEPPSDESKWTDDVRVPYFRAKTEGERAAWKVARELGLDLVTILPGTITGPGFSRNTPTIDLIESMMLGAMRMGVPRANYPIVDARDVARAHVLAAEKDCEGRFIVVNDVQPTFREMIETMHRIDTKVPLPLATLPDFMLPMLPLFDRLNAATLGAPRTVSPELLATLRGKIWNATNRRIKEVLGWEQRRSLEDTLRDTLEVLRARGSASAVGQAA